MQLLKYMHLMYEKHLIREVKESDKLNAALRLAVTAKIKEEILKKLQFN